MNAVLWNEQFKIRPRRNASIKHETIKLLLVLNLIEKYKHHLINIRIYTEYQITEKKVSDVYFENIQTKEAIAYEIQNKVGSQYLKKTDECYKNWDKEFFKTDWVLIKEKDFSDDINEINNKVKELII